MKKPPPRARAVSRPPAPEREQAAGPAWLRSGPVRTTLEAVLLAALIAFMLWPLLTGPDWPQTHELLCYPVMLDDFKAAFQHGYWYPRWLPDLGGGYGYPSFLFYQPLFFFAALPLAYLSQDPCVILPWTTALFFVLGTAGAWLLGRALGSRPTALFAAALWLLTPYLYVNLYVRGDLSELAAMQLTPWAVWALVRLEARVRQGEFPGWHMAALALALAAVITSHPATALLFFPIMATVALYLGLRAPRDRRGKFLVRAGLAIVMGLVLSSPYWLTVLRMRPLVRLEVAATGYYTASHHTVYPSQLFSRAWGFGFSFIGPGDGMPFPLGLPHFVLVLAGAIRGFRSALLQVCLALYLFLIVLMTPWSNRIWDQVGLLAMVQFPWRILSVTAVLQLVCASALARVRDRGWARKAWLLPVLLAGAFAWHHEMRTVKGYYHLAQDVKDYHARALQNRTLTATTEDDFRPHTARTTGPPTGRGQGPLVETAGDAEVRELPGSSSFRIRYSVTTKDKPALATINQLYFPGWRVEVDGAKVADTELRELMLPDGRMQLRLPPKSTQTIEAWYDGPPFWRWQAALVALACAGFVAWCVRDRRARHASAASAPTGKPAQDRP